MLKHNTQELIAPARMSDVWKIIIGVLSVLVIVNIVAVFAFARWSYNDSYWLMRYKWRVLLNIGKLDWLVLGDSAGNSGLDAGLVSREMGSSYNFCIYGDALIRNDLDMLKAHIALNGPPKGVIMVHTYDIWHRVANPQVVAHVPFPPTRIDEYLDGVPSKSKFLRDWAMERWVPLYAQASSFRGFIAHPTQLFEPRRNLDEYGYQADTIAPKGSMSRTIDEHLTFTRKNSFEVSRINDESIREICHIADSCGFDVYFALCPIYDGILTNPTFREYFDQVVRYLESVDKISPRFYSLKPFPIIIEDSLMMNVDHMLDDGAKQFTHLVMDRIRAIQAEKLSSSR